MIPVQYLDLIFQTNTLYYDTIDFFVSEVTNEFQVTCVEHYVEYALTASRGRPPEVDRRHAHQPREYDLK